MQKAIKVCTLISKNLAGFIAQMSLLYHSWKNESAGVWHIHASPQRTCHTRATVMRFCEKNTELHPYCFNRNLEGKQKSGTAYQIQMINRSSVSATTSTSADVLAASLSESRWSGMFISSQKWIKLLGTLLKCPLQWRRYPSKFTPRSGCVMLGETEKNKTKRTKGYVSDSVSMLNVKFMTLQLEKRPDKYGWV